MFRTAVDPSSHMDVFSMDILSLLAIAGPYTSWRIESYEIVVVAVLGAEIGNFIIVRTILTYSPATHLAWRARLMEVETPPTHTAGMFVTIMIILTHVSKAGSQKASALTKSSSACSIEQ